jgi:DMSO/TMAO reductase YedYZ molybdopterin-dependent catalytic subunit
MKDERQRIPLSQRLTLSFPVLHFGRVPKFDARTWDFAVEGLVRNPLKLTWIEFLKLPTTISVSDFHCVTGWSRIDNKWESVTFRTVYALVKPLNEAKFVTIITEGKYTTSLPLDDLLDTDVLLAYGLDDKPLAAEHGGPLGLVVPGKYAYKSAKWLRKLRFTKEQELGFWETRGYSNTADPWKEERYV